MQDQVSSSAVLENRWEKYFRRENETFFQRLLMFHRRVFISRAVRHWFNIAFPASGLYVEAGAGTSESSSRIEPLQRTLVALDVCHYVLHNLNVLPHKARGNIFNMPFADNTIDGIWNLGVMEHFTDEEIHAILSEFRRTLKPDGAILLLWPPWFAPYELVLNTISFCLEKAFNKQVEFFPDEINRYTSRKRLDTFMRQAGFTLQRSSFSWRDLYSYIVVLARPDK